jgi:DNA polymerase III, delta subunit
MFRCLGIGGMRPPIQPSTTFSAAVIRIVTTTSRRIGRLGIEDACDLLELVRQLERPPATRDGAKLAGDLTDALGQAVVGLKQRRLRPAPVIAAASKTPFESSRRVFVIERVDELGDEAANRMLKTLEEPASFVHLILLTDRLV